jgi:hypothetical protein
MATELRAFTVSIPAGTAIAAPAVIDVSFSAMITERIDYAQPKGASGLMGWRITSGGAAVIPKQAGTYLITDGQAGTWELADLHDSGKWEVTGYNLGAFAHAINVRFHVSPITGSRALADPLAWLSASRPGRELAEVGVMANAPAVAAVRGADLWPPVRP